MNMTVVVVSMLHEFGAAILIDRPVFVVRNPLDLHVEENSIPGQTNNMRLSCLSDRVQYTKRHEIYRLGPPAGLVFWVTCEPKQPRTTIQQQRMVSFATL